MGVAKLFSLRQKIKTVVQNCRVAGAGLRVNSLESRAEDSMRLTES